MLSIISSPNPELLWNVVQFQGDCVQHGHLLGTYAIHSVPSVPNNLRSCRTPTFKIYILFNSCPARFPCVHVYKHCLIAVHCFVKRNLNYSLGGKTCHLVPDFCSLGQDYSSQTQEVDDYSDKSIKGMPSTSSY